MADQLHKCIQAFRKSNNNYAQHFEVAKAYDAIIESLKPGETVTLNDGRVVDAKQLCLDCYSLIPEHTNILFTLAQLLQPDETVTLDNGKTSNDRIKLGKMALENVPFIFCKDFKLRGQMAVNVANWMYPGQTVLTGDACDFSCEGVEKLDENPELRKSDIFAVARLWNIWSWRMGRPSPKYKD